MKFNTPEIIASLRPCDCDGGTAPEIYCYEGELSENEWCWWAECPECELRTRVFVETGNEAHMESLVAKDWNNRTGLTSEDAF